MKDIRDVLFPWIVLLFAIIIVGMSSFFSLAFGQTKEAIIHINTDSWPSETRWVLHSDSLNGPILGDVNYGHYTAANTTHTDTLYIPDSLTNITFVIYDSYGDGMTSGSYYVSICADTIVSYPNPSFTTGLISSRVIPPCNGPPVPIGPCIPAILNINLDQYQSETTWEIHDSTGSLLYAGGPYTQAPDYQPQFENVCLPMGEVTLTMYDSYGDGLAGSLWGGNDGSYYLLQCGDTIVFGDVPNFGTDTSHVFISDTCTPPPPVPGCMDENYLEFDSTATVNDSSYCITLKIFGCTDTTMFNYDTLANYSDYIDSCLYTLVLNDLLGNGWIGSTLKIIQEDTLEFFLASGFTDTQYVYLQSPAPVKVIFEIVAQASATSTECGFSLMGPLGDVIVDKPIGYIIPFTCYNGYTNCGNSCEEKLVGCMDSLAYNYNSEANIDTLCYYNPGCTFPAYLTYYTQGFVADIDDGSCDTIAEFGCMDTTMFNYDSLANVSVGCLPKIYGCMQPLAFNYQPLANTPDTCIAVVYGCMSQIALNYDSLANIDDGSCIGVIYGCTDTLAFNYAPLANVDDNSCIATIYGCINPIMFNYCDTCNTNDGSCIEVLYGCTDSTMFNFNPLANVDNNTCMPITYGCTDPSALNYNSSANTEDFSCIPYMYGCTDNTALNYDSLANTDNGTCVDVVEGCMDQYAHNYSVEANVNDSASCLYSADCITGPGSPYWLNDPCYAWVIEVDEYCCENEWDEICQLTYNHCEDGWPLPPARTLEVKKLIRITDLLGRPTKELKNQLLFYIYDDGSVEKKRIK